MDAVAQGMTVAEIAAAAGLVATLVLLAGNFIMVGVYLGRVTAILRTHSDEIKALTEQMILHNTRISTVEGQLSYGRRKEDE